MDRLFWVHNEPSGIASAVLGCRQFLASGQTLANGDDALHVVRLLLVDGMQTYARYDGDFRPVTNRPDLVRLNLRAPTSLRNREILVDVLSLHAGLVRKRGGPLRVPAQYTQIQPSLSRVVASMVTPEDVMLRVSTLCAPAVSLTSCVAVSQRVAASSEEPLAPAVTIAMVAKSGSTVTTP